MTDHKTNDDTNKWGASFSAELNFPVCQKFWVYGGAFLLISASIGAFVYYKKKML